MRKAEKDEDGDKEETSRCCQGLNLEGETLQSEQAERHLHKS